MSRIVIDIMLPTGGGKFFATLRIEPELTMITSYYGDRPVVSISALKRVIEDKRPSLHGKDYRVIPCTDKYIFDYDYEV